MDVALPLHVDVQTARVLLERQGPSLGLWRAAEVAALREQPFETPVLDLGCGDGLVTSLVCGDVEIGLDPDGQAIRRAADRRIYRRVEASAIEEADVPCESVATVLSNSVLEHLPHVGMALCAVGHMLKYGGRLIFTVPTERFGRQLLLPLASYADWRNRRLRHLNLWSVERWSCELRQAGLEVVAVRPYLRPSLVRLWDLLELVQQVRLGRRRLLSLAWRRIPPQGLERMALWLARVDLSSPPPGGGRLIVATKR